MTDKRKKAVDKVRALRALAANNPSAEESKRALEVAAKLMAKYEITEAELAPPGLGDELRAAVDRWAGNDPLRQMLSNFGKSAANRVFDGAMQGKLPNWKELIRLAIRDAVELTTEKEEKK